MEKIALKIPSPSPFKFFSIAKNLGDHLKQSSLSVDDFKNLRSTNTNFNQITRSIFLDKANKSIEVNSDDEMKEFLNRSEQIAPDIVKCLTYDHDFLPYSYLRPEFMYKLCPGISVFIRDLTLCKYELPLDQLLKTLAEDFPNLAVLRIKLHNTNVPTALKEIRIPLITSLKLETKLQRADCTPANLIPFFQCIFQIMPNIQHLDIIRVLKRSGAEKLFWDVLIEQDFKTFGLGNLVTLHLQSPVSIRLKKSETYRKYLGLKSYLYDLKFTISNLEGENDVSIETINDFFSQMDTKMTHLRLIFGDEEMIPLGFGTEIKRLVLQVFVGSIRFIENLRQLESVKLVRININTQLFNGNEEEDKAIAMAMFGADKHPNYRILQCYDCEGGDKLVRLIEEDEE